MAGIVVSAFLSVLFEKLGSAALQKVACYKDINTEIKKWQRSLFQIREVLIDASQREITDPSVKQWLHDLQHLAYDIDDVLDELETEAMHREFSDESTSITSKVRKHIPTCCTTFSVSTKMDDKFSHITTKLQDLIDEKNILGLICVKDEIRPIDMVDVSSIVGRQVEKEALLHKILEMGDESCHQNFNIVPIVGMGGLGKTTLARLLYDEKQVDDHFKLKAWVCVSGEFDSFAISNAIFESVTGESKEFADLNLLQVALRAHLKDKLFLLVLDDVWSESCEDWETLVGPFHACARGSKIIMTTRKEQLLKKLGYYHINHLPSLSPDDALSLFAQHALGVNNFDSHPTLKPHGEGIVKKCNGLPLALKAVGRVLRTKQDEEDYWQEVLDSEIWRLEDDVGIVPALRLSYNDLSARLKRLFAYCSSFPKDYMFDKEDLVLLWMAEGLLRQPPTNSTEERLGHECFEELLSRSFFQHAPNESFFVMHDMMNDLATSVAGDFFLRLDNVTVKDTSKEVLEKYRHMSFVREEYVAYKKFETVSKAKSLRTFMATSVGLVESWQRFHFSNKILADLLPELPLLRVLCLNHFEITEVPKSIGSLRHLRYLNLSRTKITHLPESVGNLYNLQVLIVFDCSALAKLPNSFSKLKNLRHFDIRKTPNLKKLPLGIGDLNNLQTLSKIIIEGESGFELHELKNLKNICGKISIKGLDKVQSSIHAREANFSGRRLSELEVEWSDVFDVSRKEKLEKEVLNELKPRHESLKQLKVVSYGGTELPNWVGDPSFLRLKHVSIHGCKRCLSLPPVGQLPALKELFISGMDEVKVVGLELLGTGLVFPSLEILSIEDMSGLEKWSTNSGVVFPCLKELCIRSCPKLAEVLLKALPSLRVLTVSECGDGVLKSLVQIASSVTKLEIERISGLADDVWRDVIEYIEKVEKLIIRWCEEIKYLWESEAEASKVLVNLRNLEVRGCNNLVRLGKKEEEEEGDCGSSLYLTSLRELEIWTCKNMERCNVPNNIERLFFFGCDSLTDISFPSAVGGGKKLKLVSIYECKKVMKKELGGYEGGRGDKSMMLLNNNSMPILESLQIINLPNLKFIIELNCFLHLTDLTIFSCESLESFPDHQLLDLTSLKYLWITDCPRLDASFPRGLWPPKLCRLAIGGLKKPISEWGPQNFPPSLVDLKLLGTSSSDDNEGVIDFIQLYLLPSSLTRLWIGEFEKLESVSRGLQHLTSLQHLYFYNCPKMKHLPDVLLPSLLGLYISKCPDLEERCSRNGSYWPLISHIPCIGINEIMFQHLEPQMDPTSLELFSNVAFQCLHDSREGRPTMSIQEGYQEILNAANPIVTSSSSSSKITAFIKESKHLVIPFQVIEKATKNFTTVLGNGGYGIVYKGELLLSGELTSVAVKRLDSKISGQGFKEFLTEIQLLSRYKHPNLVSLLGFCDEAGEMILIYEYAEHGSLDQHLRVAKTTHPLTWEQRINICLDTAHGLDYLHNHIPTNHRVIHRDIKSANILIGHDWKAMIADLGLSKIGRANENDSYIITNASGTHGYVDPAYMDSGILTKESDVYSFGVVMFEVLCGRLCFIKVDNEHRFLARLAPRFYETGRLNEIIDPYLKTQVDSDSLKRFSEIAYPCLLNERDKRPSMGWVVQKLEEMMTSSRVL